MAKRAAVEQSNEDNEGEPLEIVEFDQSLDEVEAPPELPNGTYDGEVQNVQVAVGQASGNRYYNIQVKINQDSIPANMQEFFEDGSVMSYNRQLVPRPGDRRTLFRLRKLCENLGLPTQGVTSFDPNDIMGLPCRVQVKQSRYQGEMRAGIVGFVANDDAAPARATARTAGAANGRRAPAPEAEEEAVEEDEVVNEPPRRTARPSAVRPVAVAAGRRR